jgi:hypothetical protein
MFGDSEPVAFSTDIERTVGAAPVRIQRIDSQEQSESSHERTPLLSSMDPEGYFSSFPVPQAVLQFARALWTTIRRCMGKQ